MRLMSSCGVGADRDEVIQLTPFQNDQGRHNFREARGGHSLPSIVFIQHTPTIKFFEKNAMGWDNSPRRKLMWGNRRSYLCRLSGCALCRGHGRSRGHGTDQEETDKYRNNVGEK